MKISVLEAPICTGSPCTGSQYAFSDLVSHGLSRVMGENAEFVPMTMSDKAGMRCPENLKSLYEVTDVGKRLCENVMTSLDAGSFPLVVGGDHSCAMGSIAGASAVFGTDSLSVVYIDGHTDINTEKTTLTGFIHGMPLAAAMGLCCDELRIGRKVNLLGRNTFIVGARSIDPAEYDIIKQNGVVLYDIDEVKRRGISDVMNEVASRISTDAIHVSFDVDFMDGDEFSSTGYVMPNGASLDDAVTAFERIFATGKVRSADVVEYNPTVDTDGRDREKLFKLFATLSRLIETM